MSALFFQLNWPFLYNQVAITNTVPLTKIDAQEIRAVLQEYRMSNAAVSIHQPDATIEDFIDVVEGNRWVQIGCIPWAVAKTSSVYIPAIFVLNKIDAISIEELDLLYKVNHNMTYAAYTDSRNHFRFPTQSLFHPSYGLTLMSCLKLCGISWILWGCECQFHCISCSKIAYHSQIAVIQSLEVSNLIILLRLCCNAENVLSKTFVMQFIRRLSSNSRMVSQNSDQAPLKTRWPFCRKSYGLGNIR